MARHSALAVLLACALVWIIGTFALSFVGAGASLRGADRAPKVAMQAGSSSGLDDPSII
eukprot:CAMPEP_0171056328 /NCGR_PEP_ID=MMETSP0766_2-20121228/811_1 /TAXON_ID=439317 /ORGANISM="Gambierdiscus australes, Strain CAWD 149" /LENGTH=58 /DNA_ID=CAMNT_0011511195 /DNA_START=72 /DNA_END=245 /DNA_ORIENTATION=-